MPTIPCEVCKGSGRVPLPAALQEVLDAVSRGLNTAPAIWSQTADRANIGVTAINRRLERLTELGFVTRTKGPKRSNIYTPTKGKHHGRRSSKATSQKR